MGKSSYYPLLCFFCSGVLVSGSGGGIIEALPDRPDPAMLGGIQPVKKEVLTVQGVRWAATSAAGAGAA